MNTFVIARLGIAYRRGGPLAAVLVALSIVSGCAALDRSIALSNQPVTPITVGQAATVSADELAEAMLRAGFTREEILHHGPAVYTALATSGGAQVRKGRITSALFAVHSNYLYVTSQSRGTFVQPLGGSG